MRDPLLIVPVVVAATLIVVGRLYRRRRWGNRLAIVGYGLLAIAAAVVLVARG